MRNFFLLTLIVIAGTHTQAQKVSAKELFKTMAGSYSSAAQAAADTDFYSITLRMKPIWKKNKDGYWLYVEQAVASSQQKPYRQRVYHVYKLNDSTLVSKVYELKNPAQYIGGWDDASKLTSLTMDSIVDRQGCAIFLHKRGSTYTGSTNGKDCLSNLRGATYATSEVTIEADKLLSWDRGWNADGKQTWGAVKGGYIFIKEKELWY